jgi:uncharacterized phiE125 gp8 family phage protein
VAPGLPSFQEKTMTTTIDLGGGVEPVTLAEAKTWCRIERSDEDGLIEDLVRAARQSIEATTGLVLAKRLFRLAMDTVPAHGWIEATRRPLVAVAAIVAYGPGGEPISFDPDEAVIERALGLEAIRLSPAVRAAAENGAEVDFEAGYAEGAVPENLRIALRMIVAASYELRAAVDPRLQPAAIPPRALSLLSPYRRVSL